MEDPKDIRKNYQQGELSEKDLTDSPYGIFSKWYLDAVESEQEPTAMVLSTSENGQPNSRVVLLKGFNRDGFIFYTNYNSTKGHELAANPKVALNFHWLNLERQVRILGVAEKVSPAESDEYFDSRPLGSRFGAIASRQSQPLDSVDTLMTSVEELMKEFGDHAPHRPDHWGGYIVRPFEIEFWQGRPNRLHDRFRYHLVSDGWNRHRLYP